MDDLALRQLPLFAALPDSELQRLAAASRKRVVPEHTTLFVEGESADVFYVLLEGQLEIVKSLGTPEEITFETVQPGAVIGEMSLFSRDRRRTASARAASPVLLLEMTHAQLEDLMARFPGPALHVVRTLSVRLEGAQNLTIQDLKKKNALLTQAYDNLKAAQAQIIEKEKLEQELRIARSVQARLIPQNTPSLAGWQFNALWRPAREVSGDFYDFIPLADGRLGLVIGDAMGKSMPAALAMAAVRTMLRVVADQIASPGAALERVNGLLFPDFFPTMFVTCLYAVLDPTTGHIRLASAGHNPPFVQTASGVGELMARGMPLGLMEGSAYEEVELTLNDGERLLMYSDGLIEAHDSAGQMLGYTRLSEMMAAAPVETPLTDFLRDAFDAFVGPAWSEEDDVTILAIERSQTAHKAT